MKECDIQKNLSNVVLTIFNEFYTISIYKFGLSVLVSVCLFVSSKRQNGWTDRAQIFLWDITWPQGRFMNDLNDQNFKYWLHQNSIFIKFLKKFKIHEFFLWKSANYFCLVLRCTQREHVHNFKFKASNLKFL